MRPRGEIREALAEAAHKLRLEGVGNFTHKQLAERAQVGYSAARRTTDNMAEAGELVRVGSAKTAGGKWMTLFEPKERRNFATATTGALEQIVRVWSGS